MSRLAKTALLARRFGLVGVAALCMLTSSGLLPNSSPKASAASLAQFNPGHIIDDSIFTNYNSMNVSAIQSFLNSKVPACDTQGMQPASEYGSSLTHAQYAAAHGWQAPPYTCLRDYNENGNSAAQIIYNTAQTYQINPQVLIVLIQKESGLVNDTWPTAKQYLTATGYGCPDSTGCESQYYGLTNQLTHSGHMFREILNNDPNWYSPYTLGNNSILYSPAAGCGSSTVNIVNHATQALYDYTPYQPNAAALAAGYGTGDGCSAYGNRNFYLYFNDWFGTTIVANLPGCTLATNTPLACVWELYNSANGQPYFTSSVTLRDELYTNGGYQYVGIAYYGRVTASYNNIPVYRVAFPGGGDLLTTNISEYYALVAAGDVAGGIDFYADPSSSNTGYQVYRLYNASTKQHYWTDNLTQRTAYVAGGYTDENGGFTSIDPVVQEVSPPAGKELVYRFYIPQTFSHFWTTDVLERDNMIQAGYQYEGGAWYSSSNNQQTPVYRLYAPAIQQHLYTTSLQEKNSLVASGGWNYEGITQYVSSTPTSVPIYRLYAPSLGVHLYSTNVTERAVLLQSGKWNDEGIAWYQPF